MICFAKKEMAPQLKKLWKECFGDADRYIDLYFKHRFRADEMLVWLEGGAPVAMLTMLPAEVRVKGAYLPAQYVYAVATLPAWRGKGMSTKLLQHANELLQSCGEPLTMLVPAEAGLFDFYEKQGYHNAFALKTVTLCEELASVSTEGFALTPASPRLYKQLRDAYFDAEGYVRWDEAAIAYAMQENSFAGGVACQITSPHGQAVALCCKREDKLFVRETTLQGEALYGGLAVIAKRFACTQAIVRLRADNTQTGEQTHFGMANMPVGVTNGYLNLALD